MKYWEVIIGKWHKPWNNELNRGLDRKTKRTNIPLSWAEQPQTLGEVGSTFKIRNRTLSDGSKQQFGETLLRHEVRALMTRGVEGLYIYACDDELQQALLDAAK